MMKRKFLSLACALALLLTVLVVPTSAASRIYDSDPGTITVNNIVYDFLLEVNGRTAITTGESSGNETMRCSMSATAQQSGTLWASDSGTRDIKAEIYTNPEPGTSDAILQSTSHCGVTGTTYGLTLMVRP